jgi:hypothetical protein
VASRVAPNKLASDLKSLGDQWRGLYVLWLHYVRLEGASSQWVLDHMGTAPPANPYSDIDAARAALHAHPIHRWLSSKLPKAMQKVSALPLKHEFPLVWRLLSCLLLGSVPPVRSDGARIDKRRNSAARRLKLDLRDVRAGIISLPHAQRQAIEQFLSTQHQQLTKRRRKIVQHPALLLIAREMALAGIVITGLLMLEVAALLELNCDARTAQRYVNLADRVWGGKIPALTSNWHVLDALADDYRATRTKSV